MGCKFDHCKVAFAYNFVKLVESNLSCLLSTIRHRFYAISELCLCVSVCVCVCVCVCECVCESVWVHVHAYACTCILSYAWVFVCICLCVCQCEQMRVSECIHVYTHTYAIVNVHKVCGNPIANVSHKLVYTVLK